MLSIGELARATGTKIETIRYYERIGLPSPPARTSGNYRVFARHHLERLSFVRRGRELGFSLDEVRTLLRLSDDRDRSCAEVDRIAKTHLTEVERKLADLTVPCRVATADRPVPARHGCQVPHHRGAGSRLAPQHI